MFWVDSALQPLSYGSTWHPVGGRSRRLAECNLYLLWIGLDLTDQCESSTWAHSFTSRPFSRPWGSSESSKSCPYERSWLQIFMACIVWVNFENVIFECASDLFSLKRMVFPHLMYWNTWRSLPTYWFILFYLLKESLFVSASMSRYRVLVCFFSSTQEYAPGIDLSLAYHLIRLWERFLRTQRWLPCWWKDKSDFLRINFYAC